MSRNNSLDLRFRTVLVREDYWGRRGFISVLGCGAFVEIIIATGRRPVLTFKCQRVLFERLFGWEGTVPHKVDDRTDVEITCALVALVEVVVGAIFVQGLLQLLKNCLVELDQLLPVKRASLVFNRRAVELKTGLLHL